jgi:wobble nucleotide-excising tRNase
MIKKIDIQKFGLFTNYNWNSEVGNDSGKDIFKKVNIIYGRNYSGKTTLSRIFRCVETQKIHKDYSDAQFSLTTEDGSILNESKLVYSKNIRVYNTDFVKDNLSWLHNEDGEILPFTLLGGDNTIIEEKLKNIDEKLGVIDVETNSYKEGTLYFDKNKKKIEKDADNQKWNQLKSDLTTRLTQKANRDIKTNSNYIKQGTNYNVSNIQTEIDDIINNRLDSLLSNEERSKLEKIITEERKASLSSLPPLKLDFLDYVSSSKEMLLKKITLTSTLTELLENDLLQDWVNQGRNLHQETKTCGFCGGPITIQRRKEIDEHFSKESEELKESIEKTLNQLNILRSKINNYLVSNNVKNDGFYTVLLPKFIIIEKKWKKAIETQNSQIDILEKKLKERLQNIFKPLTEIDFSTIEESPVNFNSIVDEFNVLIKENEDKSKSIEQDKNVTRKSLRYNAIKKFLDDIEYMSLVKAIDDAKTKAEISNKSYDEIKISISKLETDKANLEKQLKDESRAADKINKHLTDFFGYDSLKLVPNETHNEGEVKTHFVIKRGERNAKNLSEGECSLIAFCYFMAKIEDELQDPNAKDNLIIYIDDPISSLDNNHIFFMFSLIESITIGVSKDNPKFCQLFISTHNLEFLKHLSNLHKYKSSEQKNRQNFIIDKRKRDNSTRSYLKRMPRYLRINISEYLYLFEEIYKMANIEDITDDKVQYFEENYTRLYAVGNIMRKFLECYICTKYPHIDSPYQNLDILFPNAIPMQINRLVQEYSHLQWGSRANLPIDVPEAEETAKKIIEALKLHDLKHYDSLITCINNENNA